VTYQLKGADFGYLDGDDSLEWRCTVNGMYHLPDFVIRAPCIDYMHRDFRELPEVSVCQSKIYQVERINVGNLVYDLHIPACHILDYRTDSWKNSRRRDLPISRIAWLFEDITGYRLVQVSGRGTVTNVFAYGAKIDYSQVPTAIKSYSIHYALELLCGSAFKSARCLNCGATPGSIRELKRFIHGNYLTGCGDYDEWVTKTFCGEKCLLSYRENPDVLSEYFCRWCGKVPQTYADAMRWRKQKHASKTPFCSSACRERHTGCERRARLLEQRKSAGKKAAVTQAKNRMSRQLQQIESFVSSKLQEAKNV